VSYERNFRGKRMRAAMDRAGLTSGQVAYRMGVSDGTVRCWTTGRRGISPDDLARFAEIVNYPVEYFFREDSRLPEDFSFRQEVQKLSRQVTELAKKVSEEHATYTAGDEGALEYLRQKHALTEEDMEAIRRIIEKRETRR
jgi:transcriptional regulator with XRE-family HTH domain